MSKSLRWSDVRALGSVSLAVVLLASGCSSGTIAGSSGGGSTPVSGVVITGAADTRLGTTTQFSAVVTGSSSQAVTWQVNGITGGSVATGTITTGGLYTAPATIPNPNTVTIGAISQTSGSLSATTSDAIWNPVPVVASAAATQTGAFTNFLIDVRGTAFVSGAVIQVGGTSLATTYVSATELQASYTSSATSTVAINVLNPNPGSASSAMSNVQLTVYKATVAAASRLLDQATFGPTLSDIQHVQTVGLDAYITEQFALAPTLLPDLPNPLPTQCAPSNPIPCEQSEWWTAAVTGPDQLRQRVALALSEMFTVSTNMITPYSVTPYQNMLASDAFTNFSTVMKDVTLSTAMGNYLNMLNSYKPGNGQIANENYARENMQLFTIGLYLLNQDGTPQLDASGNMIPAYTEAQVEAFARAYTGWTYANASGAAITKFPNSPANYDAPMAALDSAHDMSAKILLNGTTLPAGQTAAQDLAGALANLFAHANVGPFVCQAVDSAPGVEQSESCVCGASFGSICEQREVVFAAI